MTSIEVGNLAGLTRETIAYLLDLGDLGIAKLWPEVLKPSSSLSEVSHKIEDLGKQLSTVGLMVNEVILKRRSLVSLDRSFNDCSGRYLIYSPLHATMDALASGETEGFFDESDSPPWTTWVSFINFTDAMLGDFEGYLVCWIPDDLISLAQEGMNVCLGNSLFWADDFKEASTYGSNAEILCERLCQASHI